MSRVYIAAPIFRPGHLAVVAKITALLKMHELDYFSPYEASRGVWQGRAPVDCTQAERDEVLGGNIENLHTCDILLAWTGGHIHPMQGTDTGVVWEMGYFKALNEPMRNRNFTLAYIHPNDIKQRMNLMLAGTVDAVAYGQSELSQALALLKLEKTVTCKVEFNPIKRFLHEKDTIS